MSFSPELCQQYVEMLVRHDELERALYVLDNIPADYRMNVPANLRKLRGDLLCAMVTPHHYTTSVGDDVEEFNDKHEITKENVSYYLETLLRTRLVRDQVKNYNDAGVTPHLIDFGPGHFLLPRALLSAGFKFTYWDVGLNHKAKQQTREELLPVLDAWASLRHPTIFLGLEVIEHLHNEMDLAVEAVGNCKRWPEMVMLSTPYCTYRVMKEDEEWRTMPLEHLRAYTPLEFGDKAAQIFPGYSWTLWTNSTDPHIEPMSLVGTRLDLVTPKTDNK